MDSNKKYVQFFDIKWDKEGSRVKLPVNIVIDVDKDLDPDLEGANFLSDRFGYCVLKFKFEEIDPVVFESEKIKRAYLASGMDRRDAEEAISALMTKCSEIFENDTAAWEFLNDNEEQEDTPTIRREKSKK